MAIEINGKIYRNLQEQVQKNMDDIEELKNVDIFKANDFILDGISLKDSLFYYTKSVDITDTLTLTSYYLDKANGNANPDANSKCTNYIDLSTYTGFLISGHSQYATTLICTYDENKTFLRSYGDGTSAGIIFTDYQFIPQSDEKFVRFSTYPYTQYPLKVVSIGGDLAPITDKKQDNYLFNKKYVACGDSFTKGDVISSNKVYPYLIAQRNNMRFVNMAHNGSYCHYGENGFTNPNNSYYYKNIPLDADIITIAYGLNEISTPIGTKDSNDNTTIWGAYNEVLGWITTNIPNAKVGIISNDAWMTYDLRNALQEIASYWGVEFLDLKEYGKPFMISGKYSQDGDTNPSVVSQRTTQYCVSSQNGHPNELGHKVRSYIVENFLRGAYGVDNSYTRKEIDTKLDLKADKSNTYTRSVVDQKDATALASAKSYTDNAINDFRWELGSHTLDVESDTNVAFSKNVPSGVIDFQINKLGGMSYKSNNILPTDKLSNDIVFSNDTMSITNSKSGMYILNEISLPAGTYVMSFILFTSGLTANHSFTFYINNSTAIDGFSNFNNYNVNQVYTKSFTLNETSTFTIRQWQNDSESYSFRLWLNKDTAKTYKPYFDGIRDSAVTSVVSRKVGLNSLRLTQIGAVDLGTLNWQGGTRMKSQSLRGIIQPVSSTNQLANISCPRYKTETANNTYLRIEGISVDSAGDILIYDENYNTQEAAQAFKEAMNGVYLYYELANELSTPQQAILDYFVKDNLTIPTAIQNLTGYGWGINDTCYNYIDFERKVFVQKVGRADLGSLIWSYTPAGSLARFWTDNLQTIAKATSASSEKGNISTPGYTNHSWNEFTSNELDMDSAIRDDGVVGYRNLKYTTAQAFKTAMNGVYLYYELATPVETDISAYLTTDTIDVEGGGSLEFTNTYNNDVPSDIDYLIEEVKA